MAEKTIFPREEKAEALFDKILSDPFRKPSVSIFFAVRRNQRHSLHLTLRKHYLMHTSTEICQPF